LGCGTVLLTNDNPQYQDLGFIDGKNCLIYNSYDSLCGKIEMCMDDPELMIDIVKNGYDLSDKHTYYKRAKLLLQHYERFVV
jgi:spore maturation protein CgeB